MAVNSKMGLFFIATFVVVFAAVFGVAHGNDLAPAPAPATNGGATMDQGVACVLMLLALVLTYIIHTADVPLY